MCVWESAQQAARENGIVTFKTVEKEYKRQGIFDRMCRVVAEGEGVVAEDEGCVWWKVRERWGDWRRSGG